MFLRGATTYNLESAEEISANPIYTVLLEQNYVAFVQALAIKFKLRSRDVPYLFLLLYYRVETLPW